MRFFVAPDTLSIAMFELAERRGWSGTVAKWRRDNVGGVRRYDISTGTMGEAGFVTGRAVFGRPVFDQNGTRVTLAANGSIALLDALTCTPIGTWSHDEITEGWSIRPSIVEPVGFSADGTWLYLRATRGEGADRPTLARLAISGGTVRRAELLYTQRGPWPVSEAVVAHHPDGDLVVWRGRVTPGSNGGSVRIYDVDRAVLGNPLELPACFPSPFAPSFAMAPSHPSSDGLTVGLPRYLATTAILDLSGDAPEVISGEAGGFGELLGPGMRPFLTLTDADATHGLVVGHVMGDPRAHKVIFGVVRDDPSRQRELVHHASPHLLMRLQISDDGRTLMLLETSLVAQGPGSVVSIYDVSPHVIAMGHTETDDD